MSAAPHPAPTAARTDPYAPKGLALTLESTGAILLYGIPRVIVGENQTFMGGEDLLRSRGVEVVVVDSEECIAMMRDFIAAQPELWNEDIGV